MSLSPEGSKVAVWLESRLGQSRHVLGPAMKGRHCRSGEWPESKCLMGRERRQMGWKDN